jgi:hypothetical protein
MANYEYIRLQATRPHTDDCMYTKRGSRCDCGATLTLADRIQKAAQELCHRLKLPKREAWQAEIVEILTRIILK